MECVHEPLAAGPIARIDHCARCQVVSIHLGATTVRLEPGACASLWSTLGEALRVIEGRRGVPSPVFPTPRGQA